MMAAVRELQKGAEFEDFLKENAGKLVVVDFFATWCGPCKMMAPKFHSFANEFTDVAFAKVDIEDEEISNRYPIEVMPTFVFLRDGIQVELLFGQCTEELRSKIQELK